MKRIIIATITLIALNLGAINAQTDQGNMLLGLSTTMSFAGTGGDFMNMGISTIKYKSDASGYNEPDPDKSLGINMLPKVGYCVIDNLAIGLDLTTAFSRETDGDDDDKYTSTLVTAGPFVRYYIPSGTVLPYFEFGGSFGSMNSKYESGDGSYDYDDQYSIFSLGGGIGIAAPLGEKVAFDFLAGYNSLTVKSAEDNDDNYRTIIGTLGIKFGFTIFL